MSRKPTKEEETKARAFLDDCGRGCSTSAQALAQLLADHAEDTLTFGDLPRYRPPPATHTHDMVTRKGEHTPHCTLCGFRPEVKCIDPSLRREKCTKPGCPKCKPVRHG